jgi:hypothetical protein
MDDIHQLQEFKGKIMNIITVSVLRGSHANCDSLPLRFGMHFGADQKLDLEVIKDLGRDPGYPDRFHVEARFRDPTMPDAKEHRGHFVLGENPRDRLPSLVTVWSGDRDTEWGLSNTMTALRKDGFVTVEHLLEMHPLYLAGKVTDSVGLMKYLSSSIAKKDIERFERVASQAREETALAIKNLEAAREDAELARNKAERMKKVAIEAICAVEGLEVESTKQKEQISQLEARIKEGETRYKMETLAAGRDSSVATLSSPDTLVAVNEKVMVRGSACTVLVMADGSQRHMKTATFDRDGSITKKAKELVGSRVRTTCWDPIGSPGKWSRQGYFRNIYETK